MSKERRLSRKERRGIKKVELQPSRRSKSLLYSAAAGGLLTLGILGGVFAAKSCETENPPSAFTIDKIKMYQDIVGKEAERLGINKNDSEIDKWTKDGNFSSKKQSITEKSMEQATNILLSTIDLMSESENPYYRDAINFLMPLEAIGEVRPYILPDSARSGEIPAGTTITMSTDARVEGDRMVWGIFISLENILYRSNSIQLANSLVHELEHIKNEKEYLASLSSTLSPMEKLAKRSERYGKERVAEEARGHGKEARAIIHQYGLGERRIHETDLEDAAKFIQYGSNPESPEYKKYVAETLLGLPPGNY